MQRVLAIDLGGTKTAAGVVDAQGHILSKASAPTPLGDPGAAVSLIADLSRKVLAAAGPVQALGLALPGVVDRGSGALLRSPSSGWTNVPFAALVSEALDLPVVCENDVNACAWAEARFGAAGNLDTFFWITVSTGIGGAALSGNRFIGGPLAGEIGHLVVNPGGAECGCGNRGCLEAEAAGPAWRRRALELLDGDGKAGGDNSCLLALPRDVVDARALADGGRAGDRLCLRVIEDVGRMLARGLAAVFNLLDPEAIFVGGGVAAALDLLEPGIRRELLSLVLAARERPLRILPSVLGYDAALIGAASLAFFPYQTVKEGES